MSSRKKTEPKETAPNTAQPIVNNTIKYFTILTPKDMYAHDMDHIA